eukprot:2837235-Amphidinium_carterae.2
MPPGISRVCGASDCVIAVPVIPEAHVQPQSVFNAQQMLWGSPLMPPALTPHRLRVCWWLVHVLLWPKPCQGNMGRGTVFWAFLPPRDLPLVMFCALFRTKSDAVAKADGTYVERPKKVVKREDHACCGDQQARL